MTVPPGTRVAYWVPLTRPTGIVSAEAEGRGGRR